MTTGKSSKTSSKNKNEETFKVNGEELLKKVKEIIKEGNVRKITIKNKEGKTIVEFPLTIGVVGALLVPMFAAIGAIAALITECTITVERTSE
jgi:hypothetical protein